MKVLFLDFDGVLNIFPSPSRSGEFDKEACYNLEMLLNKVPDLKIVVCSSWRAYGYDAVKDILKSNSIDPRRVFDITGDEKSPDSDNHRGYQVECWLKRNPKVKTFAIVDDGSDFEHFKKQFVKTNKYNGLSQDNVETILQILKGK
jgi:hypothetical protein